MHIILYNVSSNFQSFSDANSPFSFIALGFLSFMKTTPWQNNTPIVTPNNKSMKIFCSFSNLRLSEFHKDLLVYFLQLYIHINLLNLDR